MTTRETSGVGKTVGNYDILEKIADGSMGTVYKARRWQSEEIVAIKVLSKDICRNPILLKRFEQEFRITNNLDHPNIVRMIEYCPTGETPFLVMEFVDGESLGDKLEREGRLREEEALQIVVQVAHGLHRAHRQGLIHRDVKPDNVLLTRDGKAKLTDLGLAKDVDASMDLTRTGRGLGTPNYMAPEQFRNAKNASIRCDIYSLGATLYEMLTGERPFGLADPVQSMMRKLRNELPPVREIVPGLSERVDWAVRRAMSADPNQRPESCREFVEDLTGQSTRLGDEDEAEVPPSERWYLIYMDADETVCTAQGGIEELRRSLLAGKLGNLAQIRASRSKIGPFEPLPSFAEFRDLVVQPAPGPPLSETSSANLAKLGKLMQAARESPIQNTPDTPPAPQPPITGPPPANGSAPHFLISSSGRTDPRANQASEWVKLGVFFVLGVVTTILLVKYVLPLLPSLK